MTVFRKLLLSLLLILSYLACGQIDNTRKEFNVDKLWVSVDTVLLKSPNMVAIKINWMDSIVVVNKTTRIKYDLAYNRKFRRDSTYLPTTEDTIRMNQWSMYGAQNCHSYALQKYFAHTQMNSRLFSEWSTVAENGYMNNILKTAFQRTRSYAIKKKKCHECDFTRGSLLILRNKWNSPMHAFFYDGEFHTKNGATPKKVVKSIDEIIRTYWDATSVEEYELDWGKVNSFWRRIRDESASQPVIKNPKKTLVALV